MIYDQITLPSRADRPYNTFGKPERFPANSFHTYILTLYGTGADHSNIHSFTKMVQLYNGSLSDKNGRPSYVHRNVVKSLLELNPANEIFVDGRGDLKDSKEWSQNPFPCQADPRAALPRF
ncbi:MAG: hypothetical protein R2827_15890 [Bdellovibrionales bacterium]